MLLKRPSISEVSRFHCFRNVSINFQTSEDQFIEELAKRFPLLSQKELYQGLSFFLNLLSRFSWNIEYSCRTYLKGLITNISLTPFDCSVTGDRTYVPFTCHYANVFYTRNDISYCAPMSTGAVNKFLQGNNPNF